MARTPYELPSFLEGMCAAEQYRQWLSRAASRHVKRDRKRGNERASRQEYKRAIHEAVLRQGQTDAYTGESLDWSLISTYDSKKAKEGGRAYKKSFGDMPSVDHVGDGLERANLCICSWRTNDCKSDLDLEEFIALCQKVVTYSRRLNRR
jgi:hypothetical protein